MKETFSAKFANLRRVGETMVIKPHGSLMGGEETDEIEKLIDDLDAQALKCLVVNLGDVSMMNSLAISRLIRGHLKFSKRGARMNLCNLDRRIQNIFVIAKLSLVFNVYPNEEAAVAGCSDKEG